MICSGARQAAFTVSSALSSQERRRRATPKPSTRSFPSPGSIVGTRTRRGQRYPWTTPHDLDASVTRGRTREARLTRIRDLGYVPSPHASSNDTRDPRPRARRRRVRCPLVDPRAAERRRIPGGRCVRGCRSALVPAQLHRRPRVLHRHLRRPRGAAPQRLLRLCRRRGQLVRLRRPLRRISLISRHRRANRRVARKQTGPRRFDTHHAAHR